MQVHAGSEVHEGELPVHASSGGTVTTPYAVIAFSPAFEVTVQSAEDCDRVTRAVARAKTMLGQIGAPHPFTPMARDGYRCDTCGAQNDKYHWKPEPEGLEDAAPVVRVIGGTLCGAERDGRRCKLEPHEDGEHDSGGWRWSDVEYSVPHRHDASGLAEAPVPSGRGFIAADSPVLRGAKIGGQS